MPGNVVRYESGRRGTLVRGAQRYQGVHARVPAKSLDVITRNQSTHRVTDNVHAFVPGLAADRLHKPAQAAGDSANIVGQRGVVQGDGAAKTATHECSAQQRKDGVVVDHAVHQDDRRASRLDIVDDEPAPHRREVIEIVPLLRLARFAFQQGQGVHRDVGAEPGRLNRRAPHPRRRQQRAAGTLSSPPRAVQVLYQAVQAAHGGGRFQGKVVILWHG